MTGITIDKRLAAIEELTIADCVHFFAAKNTPRDRQIIELARERHHEDGELEFDDPECIVSEGDDNGAYVLGWKWVDFTGTELDKNLKATG